MMKLLVIISAIMAVTAALPYNFVDKKTKNWPTRAKRDEVAVSRNTKYGLSDGVPYVNKQVNLANSGGHRLDANAYASKDFHGHGPVVTGGRLNYAHTSGSGVVLSGSRVPGGGTNVGAAGVWNVYRNGGFGVDLNGGYSRHFGGPFGNGRPAYGVGMQGHYAFPRRGIEIP